MAIPKSTRDQLLVEARHRCTICAEKAFEIHHIIERAEGGADSPENLIVLCPNCHQHRYHRSAEFTRDQLRLYKENLKQKNEVERRLLLNLEEIRLTLGSSSPAETEQRLGNELAEAASQVSEERAPGVKTGVEATSRWLAERELLREGSRRAVEIEWDVRIAEQRKLFEPRRIDRVDEDAAQKATDFPAACTFVLVLDAAPSEDWAAVFRQMYNRAWYNMKRKMELRGDRVTLIIADSDALQGQVDFVKSVIEETNRFLLEIVQPAEDGRLAQDKQAALAEFDAIRSLKSRSKHLRL